MTVQPPLYDDCVPTPLNLPAGKYCCSRRLLRQIREANSKQNGNRVYRVDTRIDTIPSTIATLSRIFASARFPHENNFRSDLSEVCPSHEQICPKNTCLSCRVTKVRCLWNSVRTVSCEYLDFLLWKYLDPDNLISFHQIVKQNRRLP